MSIQLSLFIPVTCNFPDSVAAIDQIFFFFNCETLGQVFAKLKQQNALQFVVNCYYLQCCKIWKPVQTKWIGFFKVKKTYVLKVKEKR